MKKLVVGGPDGDFGIITWELPEKLTEALEEQMSANRQYAMKQIASRLLALLGSVSVKVLFDDIRISKELLTQKEEIPSAELARQAYAGIRLARVLNQFVEQELGKSLSSLRKHN